MTRLRVLTLPWLLLLLAACPQSGGSAARAKAEPAEKATASLEATFTPENPHFPGADRAVAETEGQYMARQWWNALTADGIQAIPAAKFAEAPIIGVPFGTPADDLLALLPVGSTLEQSDESPLYDPAWTQFSDRHYRIPALTFADLSLGETTLIAGFDTGALGDIRLQCTNVDGAHHKLAEQLIQRYGPAYIERDQAPDPAQNRHRKTVTLTWRVDPAATLQGVCSVQVVYTGPRAGDAETLLQAGDRFESLSLTAMSPAMIQALQAAATLPAAGTP